MAYFELVQVAYGILQWVVDWMLILCGIVFMLIVIKTLFDVVQKNLEVSGPGVRKLLFRRK